MISEILSGAILGIDAVKVTVEINTNLPGDPRFVIVGLPDAAVKESQDRVNSALLSSGFCMPKTRTVVNLSPGNLRKGGPAYDLPIALGIIKSTSQSYLRNIDNFLISGELSLSGNLLPIAGPIALALLARKLKKSIILPRASANIASLVNDVKIYTADNLNEIVAFLDGRLELNPIKQANNNNSQTNLSGFNVDFADVKGQLVLRRAIEIAVSGGHNLIMIGSPGSGKSMIAKRIPTIMPQASQEELLEILSIYSANDSFDKMQYMNRPFRSPHHTISDAGLLGGGANPKPGEISLAHNGVLFLDELPEFHRSTLEVLRQPLEDGIVTISRSSGKITFPCRFMLIAAMNPCPCGFLGDPTKMCSCNAAQIQKYRSKISGPLLDRIDIHINVKPLKTSELHNYQEGESSETIRNRVEAAREIQLKRFKNQLYNVNAQMSSRDIRQYCKLNSDIENILLSATNNLGLSARAYDRILKVARTIADLAGMEHLSQDHVLEALHYRIDRQFN